VGRIVEAKPNLTGAIALPDGDKRLLHRQLSEFHNSIWRFPLGGASGKSNRE